MGNELQSLNERIAETDYIKGSFQKALDYDTGVNGLYRLHTTSYNVDTLELGYGNVGVHTHYNDRTKKAGVAFTLLKEPVKVGDRLDTPEGTHVDDLNAFLEIATANPHALQVMIDRLTEAKKLLVEE